MPFIYHVKLRATISAEQSGLPGDTRIEIFLPAFTFDRKVSHKGLAKNARNAVGDKLAFYCKGQWLEIEKKSWEAAMVHEAEKETLPEGILAWPDEFKRVEE